MAITLKDINDFVERAGMKPHLTEVFPMGSNDICMMVAYRENGKDRLIIDEELLNYEDFKENWCTVERVWKNGIETSHFKCCATCSHMHKERTLNEWTGYCDVVNSEIFLDTDSKYVCNDNYEERS